ncbi:hypothetical protein [Parenemella sanctibonifatiensis]|uniref:hypothetical protein n=1 Tax=Parenemella sanctibonifatiensis TaxID=2016505 RepID=UPI0015C5E77D|nr:hypothetical protein [Parenemella sanctibonifatiensis]
MEKAWAEEMDVANKNGAVGRGRESLSATQAKRDADSILARLKRDDPDMAERVK